MVNPVALPCLASQAATGSGAPWGPHAMVRWLAPRQSEWCFSGGAGKFDARFLVDWGARWVPLMRSRRALAGAPGSPGRDLGAAAVAGVMLA